MREEIIGNQRLILGDCLEILPTIGLVDHVICDPPYEKEAHAENRRVKDGNRLVQEGLDFSALTEDMRLFIPRLAAVQCCGWFIAFCQAEGIAHWRDSIEAAGLKYKKPMIWVKPDGLPQFNGQGPGMGWESFVTAWCGGGYSKWNGGGRHGVFTHMKGTNRYGGHPTEKPLPLMNELITLFTNPGQLIADPFMGSATTLVSCQKLGRRGIGIEKDPKYFDLACKRVEQAAKQEDLFIPHVKPVQGKIFEK